VAFATAHRIALSDSLNEKTNVTDRIFGRRERLSMNTPASSGLTVIGKLLSRLVLGRRMRVLAKHLGDLMPEKGVILDVKCGNGAISSKIMAAKPGLAIHGIDALALLYFSYSSGTPSCSP